MKNIACHSQLRRYHFQEVGNIFYLSLQMAVCVCVL